MAKVVRGVDSYKKEFLSIFNSLCGRHGRWEVWSDFIQLTAIDISNVTDKGNAPKRAADARNIAKKYSEDEIKRMAEMLMQMVYAIDENPDQDFLGELYMACNLGNDHAGQFFTPYNVCQAMSEISFDPARFEDKGFVSVNDCACGAGALLVSFANACKRHDINYQQKVMFVAQDIDYTVGLMCYIQLTEPLRSIRSLKSLLSAPTSSAAWTPCWSARLRRRRNTTKRLPCRIWMWKWQSCGLICG